MFEIYIRFYFYILFDGNIVPEPSGRMWMRRMKYFEWFKYVPSLGVHSELIVKLPINFYIDFQP